jgi:poly(A) polymerase
MQLLQATTSFTQPLSISAYAYQKVRVRLQSLRESALTRVAEKVRLDISYPTNQFRYRVIESALYNEDTMSVNVVHTRRYVLSATDVIASIDTSSNQLPDDVFLPGEVRPKKKEKKSKSREKSSSSAKRHFNETGLDVRDSRPIKTPRQ